MNDIPSDTGRPATGRPAMGRRALQRVRREPARRAKGSRTSVLFYRYGPDFLLLLLLLVAVALLVNPFTGRDPGGGPLGALFHVLFLPAVATATGFVILCLTLLGGLMRMRWHLIHNERFWKTVCPVCGSEDLRRTPRKAYHRRLQRLGVPVRRYICADCHWRGGRIDPTHVH